MFICKFCSKECKNSNSLRNHERLCKFNPARQSLPAKTKSWYDSMHSRKGQGTNQYTKAKETGIPYILKDCTRKKLGVAGTKRVWTEELRKKHSESMKRAVERNPESYTSSNRGRTKQIIFNGIKFQGSWELEYYNWCISNNVKLKDVRNLLNMSGKVNEDTFQIFICPNQIHMLR